MAERGDVAVRLVGHALAVAVDVEAERDARLHGVFTEFPHVHELGDVALEFGRVVVELGEMRHAHDFRDFNPARIADLHVAERRDLGRLRTRHPAVRVFVRRELHQVVGGAGLHGKRLLVADARAAGILLDPAVRLQDFADQYFELAFLFRLQGQDEVAVGVLTEIQHGHAAVELADGIRDLFLQHAFRLGGHGGKRGRIVVLRDGCVAFHAVPVRDVAAADRRADGPEQERGPREAGGQCVGFQVHDGRLMRLFQFQSSTPAPSPMEQMNVAASMPVWDL